MTNESEEYNRPVRVIWRDLLRKHRVLAIDGNEEAKEKLWEFILEYETLYNEILKDDIRATTA